MLATAAASAEPEHVLRISSIAPEGTGYARELRGLAAETLALTQGRVRIKPYFGAIAGEERTAWERVKRGQLDGVASAAMLCEELSPSMRVMRLPGLFHTREEVVAVMTRIKPITDREFEQAGARNLGGVMVGPVILFTREPIRTLADMRQHTYWVWDADKVMTPIFPVLGLSVLPLSIYEAGHAFEHKRHDGFVATPAAALAFQWSTLARYYEPLPLAYLVGCLVVANRAFDELSLLDQQSLASAAAKAMMHIDEVGREMDVQLLGGLFEKQGLQQVAVTSQLRAEYEVVAARARAELIAQHRVDPELVGKVEQMLSEIRARQSHP
ncbi:MAG: TRAP transporter substrate-binding protein DctP [Myxococcales bacterium]|nr:TRAP transporter substrate-binding protein DctP [Myxococcales bacterium]